MGQFLRDVDGKIPTFVGIKFTSEDLKEGLDAVSVQNKKYAVFLGADTVSHLYQFLRYKYLFLNKTFSANVRSLSERIRFIYSHVI